MNPKQSINVGQLPGFNSNAQLSGQQMNSQTIQQINQGLQNYNFNSGTVNKVDVSNTLISLTSNKL